jgi:hypothetical protein
MKMMNGVDFIFEMASIPSTPRREIFLTSEDGGVLGSVKQYKPISMPPIPETRIGSAVLSPCKILLTTMPATINPIRSKNPNEGEFLFFIIDLMKGRCRCQVHGWHVAKHMQQ